MINIQLALRNILGAGLRTWLNVIVLSFSFIVIIWLKGLLDGWDRQAKSDMIKWEMGGGQYWHVNYDPIDPFTLNDSHDKIPAELDKLVFSGDLTPVLVVQGTLYPWGRMQSILIKGIDPEQKILAIPTSEFNSTDNVIPAIIGSNMAKSARLREGDEVTLRWRDKNGAFDATEIRITGIFKTNVPMVDGNQVWIPLQNLRDMMLLPGEATILIRKNIETEIPWVAGWNYKDHEVLLADMDKIIKAKTLGSMTLWIILLLLAMLAIFDTQVLSIFRRQKEIGTFIALGMTRGQVVLLFTIEGAMHAVLASFLAFLYGFPLLAFQALKGISLPVSGSDYGISMAEKLYPRYGTGLVITTILIVLITTTIV
ncbi:MAG: FtsX-like permease family protein, partial [Bacteroidales bacterium]|nr:FtsX-like permease family protein [Bacteroidales bacterium]